METSHSFPSEESGTNLAGAFGNGNCRVVLYVVGPLKSRPCGGVQMGRVLGTYHFF